MKEIGIFPFGESVTEVVQTDQKPTDYFVLGVYASAVHAKWVGQDNKVKVRALAVASEPSIFWTGEGVDKIISEIIIPSELGRLIPAHKMFNGPSGIALNELYLNPLKLTRADAWLCDLVPHSCVNKSQLNAIAREYTPVMESNNLSLPTVPKVPSSLSDHKRRDSIYKEVIKSNSRVLVLLGDLPIKWFLKHYDNYWKKLADFGTTEESYGRLHSVDLLEYKIDVLPLAHPRQTAKLGRSSIKWYDLHQDWIAHTQKHGLQRA